MSWISDGHHTLATPKSAVRAPFSLSCLATRGPLMQTSAMTATIRQCAILAGGLATPIFGAISAETPKPVLDIGDRPFLYWLMRELQRFGVDEFVILTGHLAASVEQSVSAAAFALPRPPTLRFSVEPAPAGTGGAVHHARDMLDPRFLLCNGDSLLDANLAELLRDAAADGGARLGRMLIRRLDDASRYGVVAVADGRVTSFAERPPPGTPGTINAGIYVLDRAVLDHVAPQCSLPQERSQALFAAAAEARKILAQDPSAWAPVKAQLNLKDDQALEVYRQRYLDGVPKRTVAEEAADARVLYRRLAEIGGKELIGEAKELDASLFYDPATGE